MRSIYLSLPSCLTLLSLSFHSHAQCRYTGFEIGSAVRDGYVVFMPEAKLAPLRAALPQTDDAFINAVLSNPDTMWYDEDSMLFMYQDSVESVVGGRANCVGRQEGENNAGSPIGKLMNFFGPDYKFRFPFRTVAGADDVTNLKAINFWLPPKKNGQVLPVKWWKKSYRGRWRWVFPNNTVFGEVLFQKSPTGTWHVFEIRIRMRYEAGWDVDIFRPFATARELAAAIKDLRPDWQTTRLRRVVDHLESHHNLKRHTLSSKAYGKVFEPIEGSLDLIPPIDDAALTRALLQRRFVSVEGRIWKEGNGLETYAPASEGEFSIVPRGYKMGLIPVNEMSCNRCHVETGRPLIHFDSDVQLYGEIWGEDRIFTWHLLEPNRFFYGTFDASEYPNRRINGRLVQAGLVKNERPGSFDPDYHTLPTPY